jgi:hypothetical protein
VHPLVSNSPQEVVMEGFRDSGFVTSVEGRVCRLPKFDGKHYWALMMVYSINPEEFFKGNSILDLENLFYSSPVNCFHCGTTYSPDSKDTVCVGDNLPF